MSKNKNKNPYEVILSIVCFLLIAYVLSGSKYFAYGGLGLGIATLLSDQLTEIIVGLWSKLLMVIGKVNGFVLLSLVFFLVLTPIAFLYRLFNKDALNLRPTGDTYFASRNHTFTKKDLENPW